ncbi:retrovirus-related pol polyprotein from transposon TNT 1-94 [Tanacetum coccineum]
MVACVSLITADDVPTTYSEAVRDSEKEKWRINMSEEMQSLQKNQKWELTNLPEGKKAVGCKWVILLALVAQLDLELVQMDVETAFLHGDLKEEIYMVQPEGFKVAGKEHEVYDMLVASQSLDELKTLKTQLKSEFEMKDLDELKMILGMEIVRNRKLRKLYLT